MPKSKANSQPETVTEESMNHRWQRIHCVRCLEEQLSEGSESGPRKHVCTHGTVEATDAGWLETMSQVNDSQDRTLVAR